MSFLKKSVNLHVFFDEQKIVLEINKLVKRFESLGDWNSLDWAFSMEGSRRINSSTMVRN